MICVYRFASYVLDGLDGLHHGFIKVRSVRNGLVDALVLLFDTIHQIDACDIYVWIKMLYGKIKNLPTQTTVPGK